MRVWLAGLAIAVAVVLLPWRAHAQPPPAEPPDDDETSSDAAGGRDAGFIGQDIPVLEIDDCPPPPQVDATRLSQIGFEHFQRGEVLYVQGDYRGAVKELVAAYCVGSSIKGTGRAQFYTILKDIGQAYERELDYERAIAYLERYVMEVPKDAKRAGPCVPDPQEDRLNVIARVKSLRSLRAKILIKTIPDDATITLSNDAGIKGRGVSGQQLEVSGGRYQLLIERKGYHSHTEEIRAEIGKPYTFFTKLEPRTGTLRVRTVPANARIFLDQKQVGVGAFERELPGGRYTLSAEANERITQSREIELLADRDTPIALELPAQPQTGRRQFIAYATVGGGIAGGTVAGASDEPGLVFAGTLVGLGAGLAGSYFVTPRDIALGTSSLTITSSLIGGTFGGATTALVTDDGNRIAPAIGTGLMLGGLTGYLAGERFRISPGDAAVINSGALWGTAFGVLFSESFEATRTIRASLLLSGLAMGTTAGVLATRYFDVSRTRALLIDLGGVVGVVVGAAVQNVVTQAEGGTAEAEQTVNYTLAGLASGLILAGILTRNLDAPKLSVTPVVSKAQAGGTTTTTFGLSGAW